MNYEWTFDDTDITEEEEGFLNQYVCKYEEGVYGEITDSGSSGGDWTFQVNGDSDDLIYKSFDKAVKASNHYYETKVKK